MFNECLMKRGSGIFKAGSDGQEATRVCASLYWSLLHCVVHKEETNVLNSFFFQVNTAKKKLTFGCWH